MKQILPCVGLLLLACLAYFSGFFDFIFSPDRVKQVFLDLGLLGPIAFIFAIILLNPYFIPVITFAIPASLMWDVYTLFLILWLGIIGSCIHAFVFARYFARNYVHRKLPAGFKKFDAKITANGFTATLLIRITLGLAPPATWLLAISQIRFWPFVAGSAIGFLPLTLVIAFGTHLAGAKLSDWLSSQSTSTWLLVGLAIAAVFVITTVISRKRSNVRGRATITEN